MSNQTLSSLSHELHLKSTLIELPLYEPVIEQWSSTNDLKSLFLNNSSLPGVIVEYNSEIQMISRKTFFEVFSRPFMAELFSKRPVHFLIEILGLPKPLILPSKLTIIDALSKVLTRTRDKFDEPVVIEQENGSYKLLDSYTLILAHSEINILAMEALKEASELKSELLSIAAHDLKNPLSGIIGLTGLVLEDYPNLEPEVNNVINQIRKTSQDMFNLIIELLNTTVIESGKMNLRKQILDVNELISALIYQNKPQADSKFQKISFIHDSEEEYLIDADSIKIREAFENLLSNAIKYSPLNSEIIVSLTKNEKLIEYLVQDSGPGISEEDMNKIFGKFQRLSALPTAGESSTGLGLYIAKQIIELHNGAIKVESELEKGSKFKISLPSVFLD